MATIGLELTPSSVRAVRRGWRGAATTIDVPWMPDEPEAAAATLRATLGSAASVRLAVSPLLLRVKEISLPNVSALEQWRAIALQPARYFADGAEADAPAVAWHRGSKLAFAADAARVERWITAFSTLGTVTAVVPSAIALEHAGLPDGTFEVAAAGDSVATVTLQHGRLTLARLARRMQGSQSQPLPPEAGAAWSAARAVAQLSAIEDWESLTTMASQQVLRSRRMRSLATAGVALGIALVAALAALDYARAAYEARLDRAIVVAEQSAQPGLALRRRLAGLERESQLLRAASASTDAAQTLAALSELLPRSVVVMRLRMTGEEWQISGRARGGDAAAVVPALERDNRFTDVRMTSPSTRFREDATEFESFSVAFRVRSSD